MEETTDLHKGDKIHCHLRMDIWCRSISSWWWLYIFCSHDFKCAWLFCM